MSTDSGWRVTCQTTAFPPRQHEMGSVTVPHFQHQCPCLGSWNGFYLWFKNVCKPLPFWVNTLFSGSKWKHKFPGPQRGRDLRDEDSAAGWRGDGRHVPTRRKTGLSLTSAGSAPYNVTRRESILWLSLTNSGTQWNTNCSGLNFMKRKASSSFSNLFYVTLQYFEIRKLTLTLQFCTLSHTDRVITDDFFSIKHVSAWPHFSLNFSVKPRTS